MLHEEMPSSHHTLQGQVGLTLQTGSSLSGLVVDDHSVGVWGGGGGRLGAFLAGGPGGVS